MRRAGLLEPGRRRREQRDWRRWERGRANELWQMDVVGGILLEDGTSMKCLTGLDDHSRFCVSARLMVRERPRPTPRSLGGRAPPAAVLARAGGPRR